MERTVKTDLRTGWYSILQKFTGFDKKSFYDEEKLPLSKVQI